MTVVGEGPIRSGLIPRVKGILFAPKTEWAIIDAEPATVGSLYRRHILPLAAIGPVATLIGSLVFGQTLLGVTFKPQPVSALTGALVAYVLNLAAVYVVAFAVNGLAPSFGGQRNMVQALKVTAYAWTAAWVAGVFGLFPPLAILSVVGLYSLYLLYLGLPRLMKSPAGKAPIYTAAAVIIGLVFSLVASSMTTSITHMGMVPGPGDRGAAGTLSYKGQELDVGKAAKAVEDVRAEVKADAPKATGEELQTLLPASLPGDFQRTAVSNASAGLAGYTTVKAKGVYTRPDASIELEVNDVGAAGALAGALKIKSSKETADSYEKVGSENGRATFEKYDRPSKSGRYSVLVGGRFLVEATGHNVTIGDIKSAVAAVDASRLEAMSKG